MEREHGQPEGWRAQQGSPSPWPFEKPEEAGDLGFDETHQQQQKIIQGEDTGPNAPYSMLSCQKQKMGQDIGNELYE